MKKSDYFIRHLVIDDFCLFGVKKYLIVIYSGELNRMLGFVSKGRNY